MFREGIEGSVREERGRDLGGDLGGESMEEMDLRGERIEESVEVCYK